MKITPNSGGGLRGCGPLENLSVIEETRPRLNPKERIPLITFFFQISFPEKDSSSFFFSYFQEDTKLLKGYFLSVVVFFLNNRFH